MSIWRILCGDVREQLRTLPAGSARTCVTSPPYWGLRDYGVEGQLGLEATPDAYVAALVEVFREVRRVLADDGTMWLNLGDSYAGGGTAGSDAAFKGKQGSNRGSVGMVGKSLDHGVKAKDLVGIPWMVAFALRADGWYLRSDIIWSKPNPMPESVTDRPTKAHEYLFLLSNAQKYYYDADAIAEDSIHAGRVITIGPKSLSVGQATGANVPAGGNGKLGSVTVTDTRNKRSVWHVATQPYAEGHFATFPEALVEPCILAGSALGDTVLDPFTGSGTTGAVAIRHQRSFVGCELNPAYVELARQRIGAVAPLLAQEVA